ncbi:uncharacterized protein F13E9.13, mitochondrial isoform X1 [Octopus bimaculoides]|nr:uncharacterized protein F13E9.13, mitochondrial isoform X1 [Octopus bimaculoides]
MEAFVKLFQRSKTIIIGMIHVKSLPGTPLYKCGMVDIIDKACTEAEVYRNADIDGIILENMHDIPYLHSKDVGPEIVASMAVVMNEVKKVFNKKPIGIQILAGANEAALAVCKATGADFIRAEGFVFSHVADEGLVNACAGSLLRYRHQLDADDILVFSDIKKKHSSHSITEDIDIVETAKAAEFFLSDGVILTGTATGSPADQSELEAVKKAVNIPVLVGSGVTCENLVNFVEANAIIVGSHFKDAGHWKNDLDIHRVVSFMEKAKKLRSAGN